MMRREWIWLGLAAIVSGTVAHAATLHAYPAREMQTVIDRTGRDGERENTLVHAQPVTPASRTVVRPSPDLIYSICIYDLAEGPVDIRMTRFDAYHSLSLYDSRTNNYYVVNDLEYEGEAKRVRLVLSRDRAQAIPEADAPPVETVISPTRKGVALIRRLATPERVLQQALDVRDRDHCRPQSAESPDP